jgi:DNA-binding MarR family transcriptional regulator
MRALQLRLADEGVAFGHWTFLRILWDSDGLTQRELSEEAGVMEPTTAHAIRAMEELGYVERRQRPENRKNVYVHLTPAGRALQSKLVPLAKAVNRAAMRGVPSADVAATRRTLLAAIDNLSPPSPRRSAPPRHSARSRRGSSPRTRRA